MSLRAETSSQPSERKRRSSLKPSGPRRDGGQRAKAEETALLAAEYAELGPGIDAAFLTRGGET